MTCLKLSYTKIWTHFLLLTICSTSYINQIESYDFSSTINCTEYNCPVGTNGNVCSGHGKCNCVQESCTCDKEWMGLACQYELRSLTCENLRACVQCKVHKTGPLSEDNDCEVFCKNYPRPFIMKKLFLSQHEVFCSFVDSSNSTEDCRFVFKLGISPHLAIRKLSGHTPDVLNEEDYNNNHDVYVVAKKAKDRRDGQNSLSRNSFPYSDIITDSDSTKELIEEDAVDYLYNKENASVENRENSYTTLMILFIFIVLPFVTCIVSCFVNISNLPCGLCNIFRRPSSTYLHNVRPYPGAIVLTSPSQV